MKRLLFVMSLLLMTWMPSMAQTFTPISLDDYLRVPTMIMEEQQRRGAQEQQRFDSRLQQAMSYYQNGNYYGAIVFADLCIKQLQQSKYLEHGYIYLLYQLKGRCYEYQVDYENARSFYLKAYNNGYDEGSGIAEMALKDYNRIKYK